MRALGQASPARPDPERLARILLTAVPPDAGPNDLVHVACLRWDHLPTPTIGRIVHMARELRGDDLATEEETTMGAPPNTPEVREAAEKLTEQLLLEPDVMAKRDMFRTVCDKTGLECTYGSWQTLYFYPVRKRLRAEGQAPAAPPKDAKDAASGESAESGDGANGPDQAIGWLEDQMEAAQRELDGARAVYLDAQKRAQDVKTALDVVRGLGP